MRRWLMTAAVAAAALLTIAPSALAWKPYTHNQTGFDARADAVDDGNVTVDGKEYPVDGRVVAALRDWPSYYNAGVVGPDGFPDLTMGQSIIHPERTGAWLRYILDRAWAAQSDGSYSASEKGQILAFAYGFLTHAAGDMWAHTLVNEFAEGVFPGVGEIATDVDDAEIAIRHIIVEGYVGDATPGYDGNDDRTLLPDGDVSDDSTPGVSFAAPVRWIYQTLVRPDAFGAPTTKRGPLIDFFVGLQADLQESKAKLDFDKHWTDCAIIDPDCYEVTKTLTVNTVLGVRHPTVTVQECIGATIGCLISPIDLADDLIVNNIGSAYVGAWVDDIQDGLEHWGELGLASTKALFDPQTRRNVQNAECGYISEGTQARADCENAIGAFKVLFVEADDFIDDHLLSMLGAPDVVGDIHDLLQALGDVIDDVVGPALNPLRIAGAALEEAAKDLVKDLIEEAYGIDVDQLEEFLTNPTHWLNVQSVSLTLPVVGTVGLNLFQPWVHTKLDQYMHLDPDHHAGGGIDTGLADDAEFDRGQFAAYRNSVTMGKLLLLDGPELDHALGDVLVDRGVIKSRNAVTTYPGGSNVMWYPLNGSEPWLQLIDGDHSWRANGLPFFCERDDAGSCALGHKSDGSPGATLRRDRVSQKRAGNGEFPLWESCLLRPAFRAVFVDWENGAQQFPDLGDATSSDSSDGQAPTTTVTALANSYVSGATTFVGRGNLLGVTGSDNVFTDAYVSLQAGLAKAGDAVPLAAIVNGGTLSIPANGGDGVWNVDARASDPCNAFGATTRTAFTLDTTAPAIFITTPHSAPSYDTDDLDAIAYTVDDGAGSGVASQGVTLDGVAAANRQTLDMFLLGVGTHNVTVATVDNVGNDSYTTRTFTVHATAESLLSNLDRVHSEGKVSKEAIYHALRVKLEQALRKHEAGQHAVEHNVLGAFLNQLSAQSGKGIDAAAADVLAASARDVIATGS